MADITVGDVTKMVNFMLSKLGHPYSENTSLRLGPTDYDCSGLVWEALKAAGIELPAGTISTVDPEMNALAKLPGVQVITNPKDIQRGDVVMFHGASTPGGTLDLKGKIVPQGGHIGVALSNSEYVSAYDTQEGVVKMPMRGSSGAILAAIRLTGGTIPGGGGSSGNGNIINTGGTLVATEDSSPKTESGSIWGELFSGISNIGGAITDPVQATLGVAEGIGGFAKDVTHFLKMIDWFFEPSSWVRILSGAFGVILVIIAAVMLYRAAGGSLSIGGGSSGSMPTVMPIPV